MKLYPSLALETSALAYLSAHFHDGVATVFSTPGVSNRFVVQLVANKYNPTNYW
jgi:capping protein alpha